MEFKLYKNRFNSGVYVVGEESVPARYIVDQKYPAIFIGPYGPEKEWILDGSDFWIGWYETKSPMELHYVYEVLGNRENVEKILDEMVAVEKEKEEV